MTKWSDLFTARQLVALTTFSDLVQEARERVKRDALAAGLPDDGDSLCDGGTGATAYADAVAVYLAFALTSMADYEQLALCVGTRVDQVRTTFRPSGASDGLGLRGGESARCRLGNLG